MLPQWYYDLAEPEKATGSKTKLPSAQVGRLPRPQLLKKNKDTPVTSVAASKKLKAQENELKIKKAWEVALAPAKALPMNFIMSYFSGNGLQIVTISMTMYMFFLSPLKQIFDVQQKFAFLEGKSIRQEILLAKIVYVLCSLAAVGVGVWKVSQMGLLPTHSSDWAAWEEPAEYYDGGVGETR